MAKSFRSNTYKKPGVGVFFPIGTLHIAGAGIPLVIRAGIQLENVKVVHPFQT